jgi:receptor protein-tyrosine kinase
MTVDINDAAPVADGVSLHDRVRDSLLQSGVLTPEGAARIEETMRGMGLEFGDAALHLGLVTYAELAAALESTRRTSAGRSDGIIEGALQMLAGARSLPVKYHGIVRLGPTLSLVAHPESAYSERIRSLRTELLMLNGDAFGGTSIAMLSPCQGEGRTQLSAELAIAFSQLGRRTLLVDADLRRPHMHYLFSSENPPGLAQALALRKEPQLLSVEKLPHLSLLTAGPAVQNPLELLSGNHFERLMTDWRKKYHMVILDTPPISEYADGLAIASCAEQGLIVSRADCTPHKNMKEMLRRVASTRSRIVGAVINRF